MSKKIEYKRIKRTKTLNKGNGYKVARVPTRKFESDQTKLTKFQLIKILGK